MAINLGTLYPTQTTPADANWPQGGPKNVTSPLDGTGTPFKADGLGADLCALMQRAIVAAGMTPSGTPDTGADSQIFDALMKAANPLGYFSARLYWSSTTAYVAESIPSIDGFEIVGDGGDQDLNGNYFGRFKFNFNPATVPSSGGGRFNVVASVAPAFYTGSFAAASITTDPRINGFYLASGREFETGKDWFELMTQYTVKSGVVANAATPPLNTTTGSALVVVTYDRRPGVTLPEIV